LRIDRSTHPAHPGDAASNGLREAAAAWKYGVVVLLTLTLASVSVMFAAAVVWFALNALPLLLVEGWTFERSLDAFGWTALVWTPIAYSIGARYLPPSPDESD
jgi:hypothetical protein